LSVSGRRRFGISRRLSLAFATIAIIPLAVALVASVSLLLEQARIVESEVLWGKVRLAALSFEARRDALERALDAASRDNAVLVNLELGLDSALSGRLADFLRGQDLDGAWVSGPAGGAFASAGVARPEGHRPPRAEEGTTFEFGGGNGRLAYLIGTHALVSGRGSVIGYLCACISLRRLCAEASAASKTPAFILLSGGEWILSPELDAADTSRLSVPASLLGKGREDPTQRAIGSILGTRYLMSVVSVAAGGASARLGVAYPESMLSGPRDRGIIALLLSGLLALALAGAGGLYFRRSITRPVLALARAARKIAQGVYGEAVAHQANDELGDLARDFNRMSERLLEQDEERERAATALRASELQFRSIFDGVGDAIFVHDMATGVIVDANRALTAMFGLSREETIDSDVSALSDGNPPYDAAHALELIRRAASGDSPVVEWKAHRKDGSTIWVEVALKRASIGGVDRVLVACRDIGARKEAERLIEDSLREKETLLREIHHRVKNNFQIINSLFDLQLMGTEDPAIREGIREPKARIHAMALIHERLYQSRDLSSIDFAGYVGELARELFFSYNAAPERIALEIEAESVSLDMDRAIPCGLVLNELMTNALKYAFPGAESRGRISVRLERSGGSIILRVEDDGVGIGPEAERKARSSLGLTLVKMLSEQLRGGFELELGTGVKAILRFPY
jgi:PAS domain S-box-containing protein